MKNKIALIAGLGALLAAANFSLAEVKTTVTPFNPRLAQVYDHRAALSAAPDRTLIIPKDAAQIKNQADMEEDLNVMARILDKAVGAGEAKDAMGIVIRNSILGGRGGPRQVYLEGYGALFLLNVNYPLLPPAATKSSTEPKDQTSSEWEEARRELSQPPGELNWTAPAFGPEKAEAYDGDKVEQLKTDLISALKNAAYVRNLKPDEVVTVIVTGRAEATEVKTTTTKLPGHTGVGTSSTYSLLLRSRGSSLEHPSRLILRVKKSDAEAFQKEKIKLDDFRNKVAVMIY